MATNQITITDAGLAEIVNAEQNGTAPVAITEVGYGTGKYTATGDMTSLKAEFKRITMLSGGAVGDNVIHLTARDNSTEAYSVYEIGLYTSSGTLFAVYSQLVPIIQKAAQSQAMLSIDLVVSNFSADSIVVGDTTFFNPPATTTTMGVVELATNDETSIGSDSRRAVTPAGLSARTATQARTGLIKLAAPQEVLNGTDNTKAVTPAGMLFAFAKEHGASGFQRLPGGTLVQWGRALIAGGAGTAVVFPTAFPLKCSGVFLTGTGGLSLTFTHGAATLGGVPVTHNGNGGAWVDWLAVGY